MKSGLPSAAVPLHGKAASGGGSTWTVMDEIRQNLGQTSAIKIDPAKSVTGEGGKENQAFNFRFGGKPIQGANQLMTEEGKRHFLELLGDLLGVSEVLHESRQKCLHQTDRLRLINNQFSGMLRESNRREESNHTEMRKQRSALVQWHENYSKLKDDAQNTITTLLSQREELERKLNFSNDELKRVVDINEQLQKDIHFKTRDLNRYKEFREVYTNAEKEKEELQAEFEGILLQYSRLQSEKNALEADKTRLQAQVDDLNSKVKSGGSKNIKVNIGANISMKNLDEQYAAGSPFPPISQDEIKAAAHDFDSLSMEQKRMRMLELLERMQSMAQVGHTYYKYTKFLMAEIDKTQS